MDEKPTGSSDAFGLRRSAVGAFRITASNGLRIRLLDCMEGHVQRVYESIDATTNKQREAKRKAAGVVGGIVFQARGIVSMPWPKESSYRKVNTTLIDLLGFLADRVRAQLREQGKRHDLVDAVFALGDDDLVRIVARVEALEAFLGTDNGKNLLAGYKRAANILAAEEKKGALAGVDLDGAVNAALLKEPAEKALAAALAQAAPAAKAAVAREDFAGAMAALAQLRTPVDAFMTDVLVNADDKALRANRLKLLHAIRASLAEVADFSKIEG
jgi:glycyl-tRNA synthetase beta chain